MNNIIIFTDGSYTSGIEKAGIGVFYPQFQKYNLSENLPFKKKTCNRAELWAIIRALQTIKTKEKIFKIEEKSYIKIYTDSALMVNTFNKWIKNWVRNDYKDIKNVDLLKIAYEIIHEFKIPIKFKHVRSHQRKPKKTEDDYEKRWFKWYCNNEADRFAKAGANTAG